MCNKRITQLYLPPTHEPYLPLLPSCRASPAFGWYSLRLPMKWWPGWVDLGCWSHTEINVPHLELNPDAVTHPSTNWARCRVTSLMCAMPLPLSQAAAIGIIILNIAGMSVCVYVCCCSTVLMLLKMVIEYCQLATDIPSASPEILNRLIELLKVWWCVIFCQCRDQWLLLCWLVYLDALDRSENLFLLSYRMIVNDLSCFHCSTVHEHKVINSFSCSEKLGFLVTSLLSLKTCVKTKIVSKCSQCKDLCWVSSVLLYTQLTTLLYLTDHDWTVPGLYLSDFHRGVRVSTGYDWPSNYSGHGGCQIGTVE